MPYVNIDAENRLFYRDWGTGPTVVFIHGWAVGGDMWEYQMNFLPEQGLRCIAYDQRSCGRSDDPGHGYDYDTLADDLALLLEKLDLKDVMLVGHSMGSGVIARYLSRYGSTRITRTMLVAPTTPCLLKSENNTDGMDRGVFEETIRRLRKDRAGYLDEIAPGFFGEGLPGLAPSPAQVQWGVNLALQASAKATIDMVITNSESDLRADMCAFTMPTWIVQGDSDQGNPIELTGRKTAALIPGSRLLVYENGPHGLPITHSERFNSDLLTFMRT